MIEKQKASKTDKSSQFIVTIDDTDDKDDKYKLTDLESEEFTVDRNEDEEFEVVTNFMQTSTKAIHETFNTQQFKGAGEALDIIFNQKLSDYKVHITYNSSNLITSLNGCAMMKSGSCYIEMDEGCEIILSTWKN